MFTSCEFNRLNRAGGTFTPVNRFAFSREPRRDPGSCGRHVSRAKVTLPILGNASAATLFVAAWGGLARRAARN
jgi:hypothetical protein